MQAEHRKLEAILDDLLQQLVEDGLDAVRARWGGLVREALEYAVAEERVVWEALPTEVVSAAREHQQKLRGQLEAQDALNPTVDAEQVRATADLVKEYVRQCEEVLVPALTQLSPARRMALGEDLRQVMG